MKTSNVHLNGKKILSIVLTGYFVLVPGFFVENNDISIEREPGVISYENYKEPTPRQRIVMEPAIMPEELNIEKVLTKKKKRNGMFFD